MLINLLDRVVRRIGNSSTINLIVDITLLQNIFGANLCNKVLHRLYAVKKYYKFLPGKVSEQI